MKLESKYGSEWDTFCQQHKIEVTIEYKSRARYIRLSEGFAVPYFDTLVRYLDRDILNIKTDFPPNDDYLLMIVKPLIREDKIKSLGI